MAVLHGSTPNEISTACPRVLSEEHETGKELKKRERHRKAVQWKKKTEGNRQKLFGVWGDLKT